MRTDLRQAIAALALLALAAALPFLAPAYYTQFAAKVLLIGILAMALNLVCGFGGLASLCHAAFFGLAGYVLALATPRYEAASLWLTLPLAVGAAALAAAIIGALSLRARGIYFIMVTLAFGQMLFYLFHDTKIAGGSDGAFIYFKPQASAFGVNLINLDKAPVFYWLVLAITAAVVLFLWRLAQSPFGRARAAARDNERRARSLGFPIYRLQLNAFIVSGALAGIAGYFSVAQFGYVAPQMLGWHFSAIVLVMVVLGGMRSVTGPLVGAALIMGIEEALQGLFEYWRLAEGLIIIAIVLAFPGGVYELRDRIARHHRAPGALGGAAAGGEHG